jgi:hypothetical protein
VAASLRSAHAGERPATARVPRPGASPEASVSCECRSAAVAGRPWRAGSRRTGGHVARCSQRSRSLLAAMLPGRGPVRRERSPAAAAASLCCDRGEPAPRRWGANARGAGRTGDGGRRARARGNRLHRDRSFLFAGPSGSCARPGLLPRPRARAPARPARLRARRALRCARLQPPPRLRRASRCARASQALTAHPTPASRGDRTTARTDTRRSHGAPSARRARCWRTRPRGHELRKEVGE